MKDHEQLLHILMQLHLKRSMPISFKGLVLITKWDTSRLSKALKHGWFKAVWDPDLRSLGYLPTEAAFQHVAVLYYREEASPFDLEREELPDDMGAFAETADCVEERDFETESVG